MNKTSALLAAALQAWTVGTVLAQSSQSSAKKLEDILKALEFSGAPTPGALQTEQQIQSIPAKGKRSESAASDADWQGFLDSYLSGSSEKSVAGFVAALPAEFRRNFVLMHASESLQKAGPARPRVICQSGDSRTLVAFNINSPNVEMIHFDGMRFQFYLMTFKEGQARLQKNPVRCASCHNGRPNWDAYDNWAMQLPFHRDRIYQDSEEEEAYKRIVGDLSEHPVFKQLELPKGVTVSKKGGRAAVTIDHDRVDPSASVVHGGTTVRQGGNYRVIAHPLKGGDEGQAVALFDQLTKYNAKRVAIELKAAAGFDRFKYAARAAVDGALRSSGGLSAYLPPETIAKHDSYFKMGFDALLEDTKKRRRSLPALKWELQTEALSELIKFNAQARGQKLSEDELKGKILQELLRRNPESRSLDVTGRLVDREDYRHDETIAVLRYLLEPEGVKVGAWSMSSMDRAETYTFADLFSSYQSELRAVLPAEYNAALSRKAYKARP